MVALSKMSLTCSGSMISTSSHTTPRWGGRSRGSGGPPETTPKLFQIPPHLSIIDVMHLIENDPLQLPDDIGTVVEHRSGAGGRAGCEIWGARAPPASLRPPSPQGSPQDLGGHDEAGGLGAQLHIPRQQTHVPKCHLEIPELLVGECLDGGGVDGPEGHRGGGSDPP